MTIFIISVVVLSSGACCGLILYACCKIGSAYDRTRDAIDADWEEVPAEKPGVGLWV